MLLLQLFNLGFLLGEFIVENIVLLDHFLLELDHQVEVLMGLLEGDLGFGQLLLDSIELDSDVFFIVFDLDKEITFLRFCSLAVNSMSTRSCSSVNCLVKAA